MRNWDVATHLESILGREKFIIDDEMHFDALNHYVQSGQEIFEAEDESISDTKRSTDFSTHRDK